MYTRIGKYIHDKRMGKKIRLKDVGKVLSLTVTNVYHKESGIRKFTLKEAIILSEMLDFSLDELKKEALKGLKEDE